jgi:type II restriction enzyme
MFHLAYGDQGATSRNLFLVAPDEREKEGRAQLSSPAFSRVGDLDIRYLPYGELRANREAIARFGAGLKGMLAIALPLGPVRVVEEAAAPGF